VTNMLFELLNNISSEIWFLKAQVNQLDKNNKKNTSSIEHQDIVKSESIPKPARLKYINLAEASGLDHGIILEY
ncbi:41335_t:CDS:2, partial [Gigaspora margarita]